MYYCRPMSRRQIINISLPPHTFARLNQLAQMQHRTRSGLVAHLIEIWPMVADDGNPPVRKRRTPKQALGGIEQLERVQ